MTIINDLDDGLIRSETSAHQTILDIRNGHKSPLDVIDASISRIEAVEPFLNAFTCTGFEQARERASYIQDNAARTGRWPMLCGLPLGVKDNADAQGLPTSGGSALVARGPASASDPVISALEQNGAIAIGKTNLSELGGANTTNALFGPTLNPHDTRLTAGGSSGGTAAALASGEIMLGHGNDVAGSLRTPAAFCGVAGLRPTPGIVPRRSQGDPFDTIFVEGPMARDIDDLALVFDAMMTDQHADMLCAGSSVKYTTAVKSPTRPTRIGFSTDLGFLPVDASVRRAFQNIVEKLSSAGLALEEATPDLAPLAPHIATLRGQSYATNWSAHWPDRQSEFTPDVRQDIICGRDASGESIALAQRERINAYHRTQAFFQSYDHFLCPTTQVAPFHHSILWPKVIDDVDCTHYIDWIAITYIWSLLGSAVLALPAGYDENHMPFSIQLISRPRGEAELFRSGAWISQALA